MWFRVELHKDGSVASCEVVEGKLRDGKHVVYVEADSKEKAVTDAVAWYKRIRDRNLATKIRLRTEKRCVDCGAPAQDGYRFCAKHLEIRRARNNERYKKFGRKRADPLAPRRSEAESAAQYQEKKRAAERRFAASIREEFGMSGAQLYQRRRVLREVASAYDSDPRGFRSWLTAKLKEVGADSEPFAFESAAE